MSAMTDNAKKPRLGATLIKSTVFLAICVGIAVAGYQYRAQIPGTILAVHDFEVGVKDKLTGSGPCEQPVTYSLGEFDTGFGLSKAQFLAVAAQAASIWNAALGKTLVAPAAEGAAGDVIINLVYDYRQQATDQLKKLGVSIDTTKSSYEALKARYDSMIADYNNRKATLDSEIVAFETAKAAYESEVSSWNSRGGAPPVQYAALQREKAALDIQVAEITQSQNALNQSVNTIDATVSILNGLVNALNLNVKTFNGVSVSAGKQFNEGEYVEDASGQRIYVYEFADQDKLLRVLAHELGHALGLEHVSDQNAIMYYLNEGSNEKLTAADLAELKRICGVK